MGNRLLLLSCLLLTGCNYSAISTLTPMVLPTSTIIATASSIPIASPSPSLTRVPRPTSPITVDNVSAVRLLVSRQNGEFASSQPPLDSQVVFTPDGRIIGVASRDGVYLYTADSLDNVRYIKTMDEIITLAFSPDGEILATGSIFHTLDLENNTLQLWRVSDGTLLKTIDNQDSLIQSIAFSPDGRFLASGGMPDDGLYIGVRIWQVADSSLARTLKGFGKTGGLIQSISFSPDSQILAGGASDGVVRLWRASTGEGIGILDGKTAPIDSMVGINTVEAFSPDGNAIALAANYDILLRRVSDGNLLRILKGHLDCLSSLTFSPDGQLLASASSDHTVRLWQVSDGSLLRTLDSFTQAVNSVDFSPDGRTLAMGSADGTVQLWGVFP